MEEQLKDIKERIEEIKADNEGISNVDIAKILYGEGYPLNQITHELHVGIKSIIPKKEAKSVETSPSSNADNVVENASAVQSLEEFKRWAMSQTHYTIKEIVQLGQLLQDMGVKARASELGLPLWDYIQNAINFYSSYYDCVTELLRLRVINLEGKIDKNLLCVQEGGSE